MEMETGVRGGGDSGREGRVVQASLAWTSEGRMLHCLFNREQISKKIEAPLNGGGVSNYESELSAEGCVAEGAG